MSAVRPIVSVIVPVHNRVTYLRHAIDSVMNQGSSSIEVIVIDDGSAVDPAPITAQFDHRVRLLRQANGGLAAARNFGIRHARGEYLMFLDDDDFLEPGAIPELVSALASVPGATWAAGHFDFVDEHGHRQYGHGCRYDSGDIYPMMIAKNLIGAPSAVLVSTAQVRTLGGFDEAPCYHMAEDYDLWLSMARMSPIAVTRRKVTNYRLHAQQFTKKQPVKHMEALLAVLRKQRALARPGHDRQFRAAIATLHQDLGDKLYLTGKPQAAVPHWKEAAADGALSRRSFAWRMAKARLPGPLLAALRGAAKMWRGQMRREGRAFSSQVH